MTSQMASSDLKNECVYIQGAPQKIEGQVPIYPLLENTFETMAPQAIPKSFREFINERYEFGLKKYGTPLMSPNGRDMIKDAKDELGDAAQYIAGCIHEGKDTSELLQWTKALVRLLETEKHVAKGAKDPKVTSVTSTKFFWKDGKQDQPIPKGMDEYARKKLMAQKKHLWILF